MARRMIERGMGLTEKEIEQFHARVDHARRRHLQSGGREPANEVREALEREYERRNGILIGLSEGEHDIPRRQAL